MRAVCYIPAIECLIYQGVQHWIQQFERTADLAPTDVVLPAFTATGASYSSTYSQPAERLGEQNTLKHWVEQVRSLLPNAKIWASLVVTIPSLCNESIALRDQWEQSMSDACIVNPRVQQILDHLFNELRQFDVKAVVLDITDAFPNSTSAKYPPSPNGDRPMQNVCFCRYCIEAMRRDTSWAEGAEPFRKRRNLSRFVLKPMATPLAGASWNDVKDSWIAKLDGASLADFADARGFTTAEDDGSRKDAVKLLQYLAARATVTSLALKRLGESAAKVGLETAIVLGSGSYDMSQNVNLRTLVDRSAVDEYWLPAFDVFSFGDHSPVLLRFLAVRSSYYTNALFDTLNRVAKSDVFDPAATVFTQLSENSVALEARSEFTKGQCAQVKLFDSLQGFVGVPFKRADLVYLINAMASDGSLSDALRKALLGKLESAPTTIGTVTNLPQTRVDVW